MADVPLDIPVRNNGNSQVHLIVSPELVDFIVSRADFRPEPSPEEAETGTVE
jgi:hypothetical protein